MNTERFTLSTIEGNYPLPPQYKTAIRQVREKCLPEIADKIDNTLLTIDRQVFNNLSKYTNEKFPGVILPYSTFSAHVNQENNTKPQKQIYEVIINGFAVPPEGHPIKPEVYYNRFFDRISEAQKSNTPTAITFLCVGQVSGEGGKTTPQFNKAMKKHGFGPESELIESLTESLLPQDEKENLTLAFYGRSMGAIKALETASRCNLPGIQKEVILDNPPKIPALSKGYQPRGLQIMIGYALEGLLKKRVKKLTHEIIDPSYPKELKTIFEEKGIDTYDSLREKISKERVIYLNVRNILKNKIHQNKDFSFPVKVKVGGFDPLNISVMGLMNTVLERQETVGNVEVDFVKSTHSLYKYPIDEWVKTIDRFTDSSTV